eukprot:CAMPEP_0175821222 /NCGR_PEP_ID=MMETSP0107_2-20121207/9022_1 /TAXON_ID=195067 ORGANISM="Goniomonas pacifica, Strain CCMP1869" /NCGR_SAMPLE_ID=MMETSP0107_2 /ASSEMBLY_ACC=CAM_ASM_000203 /LENGTH=43 /DNA_ID= /DNA_START= /DNA_END= /DNA_ORIENTATION=
MSWGRAGVDVRTQSLPVSSASMGDSIASPRQIPDSSEWISEPL